MKSQRGIFGFVLICSWLQNAAAGSCNHNDCLRALLNPTRDGAGDCSAFLSVTVTPAASTIVNTIYPTVTAEAVTITTTVEAGDGGHSIRDVPVAAQPVTVGGTTFPVYASACTSFAKYSSACSCVGVTAATLTVDAPSTTVTETATPVTVTPTATVTVINIVRNGGFETGEFDPWVPTTGAAGTRVYGNVSEGGDDSTYRLETHDLFDNRLFEIYQDLYGESGVEYSCSYNWKFTNYYETVVGKGRKAVTYVPYIHGYLGNDLWTTDIPDQDSLDEWQTTEFTFVSTGVDRWWFDCASPQPSPCHTGGGANYLSIDNVICVAVSDEESK